MKNYYLLAMLFIFSIKMNAQNNALHFDGDNDYISFATPLLPTATANDAWTIEMRIQTVTTAKSILLSQYINSGSDANRAILRITNTGKITYWKGALGFIVETPLSYNDGQWHHIALVKEGSGANQVHLYMDGVLIVSGTDTLPMSNVNTEIGRKNAVWYDREPYLGKLDEARIWNTARTQTEIQANKDIGLVGTEAGLTAYYNFNQGVANANNTGVTTLTDITTNANNGTLDSFSLNGTDSNWVGQYPKNDTCATATNITVSNTLLTKSIDEIVFSTITNETLCADPNPKNYVNLWYDFTLTSDTNVYIYGDNQHHNLFALYDGCSGAEITCFSNNKLLQLQSGINYKLRVFRLETQKSFGNKTFTIQSFAQPANDTCALPENITLSETLTTYNFDLRGATPNTEANCTAPGTYYDVWYDFTMPTIPSNLYIKGGQHGGNKYAVYDACGGTVVHCFNNGTTAHNNEILTNLTAGATYKLRVYRAAVHTATPSGLIHNKFEIRTYPKNTNIDCLSASTIVVTETNLSITPNLAGANLLENQTVCTQSNNDYYDAWYTFTMPVSGNLTVSSSDLYNYYELFDACAGNSIHCSSGNTTIQSLVVGTTYKLRISREESNLEFNPDYNPTFTVVAIATVNNDTCTNAESITVSETENTVNFEIINAQLNTEEGCSGSATQSYADIWYEFTMPTFAGGTITQGNVLIDGTASTNKFAIYDACGGTEIDCFENFKIVENLTSGTNYKIRVYRTAADYTSSFYKSFKITAFADAQNDDCATSENITVTTTASTVNFEFGGAQSNLETLCGSQDVYVDLWYDFTLAQNGSIQITDVPFYDGFELYDACAGTQISCFTTNGNFNNLFAGTNYKLRLFRPQSQNQHSEKSFNIAFQPAVETYVPDNNFEQALIDLGYDTILDDYVPTSNINTITSLDVNNKSIADLTGIEDFVALTSLFCNNNQLPSLDLVSNTALTQLDCSNNLLTSLDIVANAVLTQLDCDNNQLTSLYVANGNNANIATANFVATNNPNLTCIEVDDVTYSTANWTNIDAASSFSEHCFETYVPNNNFENYLETHDASGAIVFVGNPTSMGNGIANDDYVTTTNINTVTVLDVNTLNINDLTGIEDFIALTNLQCHNNQLTSLNIANIALTSLVCNNNPLMNLDISANTALTSLSCENNQLTSLDVSANTALKSLLCVNNQLTSLDVSANTDLTYLNCSFNPLTSLDVSANTALKTLNCYYSQLTSLDLSINTALIALQCNNNPLSSLNVANGNNANFTSFYTENNPNLTCIQVDDVAYSTANWTNIDPIASFSTNCNFGTYVPDDNFEQALIDLGYDSGALDNYVPTANISSVASLDVSNKNILNLTGIENFTALTYLHCANNLLTSLDVTTNIALTELRCFSNQLTSLDVTTNTALTYLNCGNNQLTSLDVATNTALIELWCSTNQLTSLDIATNTALTVLWCSTNQLTSLDLATNTALIELYCTSNQLSSLNIAANIALVKLYCAHNQLTNLGIITNTALTHLSCHTNQLTSLNVANGNNNNIATANFNTTNNPNLTCIEVDDVTYSTNNWTNIDITSSFSTNCSACLVSIPDANFKAYLVGNTSINTNGDTEIQCSEATAFTGAINCSNLSITDLTGIEAFAVLTKLYCHNNQLTSLDVSANTALTYLYCQNNQLMVLDVTNNIALTRLSCSMNQLTSLDVATNTTLIRLYCQNNQLMILDISTNTVLTSLLCNNNQLTSLYVANGNNNNISTANFNTTNNPNLTCIEVDDVTYSTNNWTNIDATSSFSIDCNHLSIWIAAHWVNGAPNLTKNAIIDDDYNTATFGNIEALTLTINTAKNVTISPNSYIKVDADMINNGTITIEPKGSFVQINDMATVTGTGVFNTKIETTPLQDEFRVTYFSSPSANQTLNTFAPWADMSYLWEFNETTQNWDYITDTATAMQAGNGYIVRGNSSNTYPTTAPFFTGLTNFQDVYNNGVITQSLIFKGDGSTGANLDNDSNLVGNPYPSAISGTKLLNNTLNPTAGTLYFWTHNSGLVGSNFSTDDYALWNLSGGTMAISGGTMPTGYIASGQGFFIDAEGDETLPLGQEVISTLTFNNDMRETLNNTDFRRLANLTDDKIWLNLSNNQGVFNQTLLAFLPNVTTQYDTAYDGKRGSNGVATFYSIGLENQHYGIQALPLLQDETTIPMGYQIENENITNLTISIDYIENMQDVTVYLKDNLLNVLHDLSQTNYSFTVNGLGVFDTRFEIIFRNSALSTDSLTLQENLIVSSKNDTILIKTTNGTIIKEVEIYDVLGKLIINTSVNKSEINIPIHINQGTVLFIKAQLENSSMLTKKIIKQ